MNYSVRSYSRNATVVNVATVTIRQSSEFGYTFTSLDFNTINTTIDTTEEERSCVATFFLATILGFIVIITVVGNVLVIASIVINVSLRTTTYYFIANLAIADLLLGTTVLPFSATLEVLQYWAFGQIFCDAWAAFDVLCCTASILSLCVISIDRYIGVTRPLQHGRIMCQARTIYVIIFVWLLSVAISVAPLIGWKEAPNADPRICTVTTQPGYVLFSVAGSFYIPCLIILVVYFRIYLEAVKYTKCLTSGAKLSRVNDDSVVSLRIHLGRRMRTEPLSQKNNFIVQAGIMEDYNSSSPQNNSKKNSKRNSRPNFLNKVAKFNREKKAAKTLGIVVGVFITCWLPFFIVLPLDSLCTDCNIPPLLFKMFFWLGYCNSMMNPIIYTCSSNEFRRAFLGILCCRRCRKRRRLTLEQLHVRAKTDTEVRLSAFRQKRHQRSEPDLQLSLHDTSSSSSSTPGTCNLVNGSLDLNSIRNTASKTNVCSTCKTNYLSKNGRSPVISKHVIPAHILIDHSCISSTLSASKVELKKSRSRDCE